MKQNIEIPEGYEFDHVASPILGDGGGVLSVLLKKKQTKDFNYFVDQYLPSRDNSTSDEIIDWMDRDTVDRLNTYLKTKQFNLVPWEIKIGLFRFICKEKGMDFVRTFSSKAIGESDIFPQEFIDDLFK